MSRRFTTPAPPVGWSPSDPLPNAELEAFVVAHALGGLSQPACLAVATGGRVATSGSRTTSSRLLQKPFVKARVAFLKEALADDIIALDAALANAGQVIEARLVATMRLILAHAAALRRQAGTP